MSLVSASRADLGASGEMATHLSSALILGGPEHEWRIDLADAINQ